jgi:hypothetical protein
MTKFTIDFWMDGYDSEEEMNKAAKEYIFNALDSSGTSVRNVSQTETPQTTALKQIAIAAVRILTAMKNGHCEHDCSTEYPSHVWYCDDCWISLQDAIAVASDLGTI